MAGRIFIYLIIVAPEIMESSSSIIKTIIDGDAIVCVCVCMDCMKYDINSSWAE